MDAEKQKFGPMEMALAASVTSLIEGGQIPLDIPDAALCDVIAARWPQLDKPAASGIDAAAVALVVDKVFQSAYAAPAAAVAATGKACPPPLLPVDPTFVYSGACNDIEHQILLGRNFVLSGPSGSCKTFPVEQVLRRLGRRYIKLSVAAGMDASTYISRTVVTVENGVSVTKVIDGIVTIAARGNFVVILDELDSTTPENNACLRSILDSGVIVIPETGERIVAGNEFLIIATCNRLRATVGGYSGYDLDTALVGRFQAIEADYMAAADEVAILEANGLSNADAVSTVAAYRSLRDLYLAEKLTQAPSTRAAVDLALTMQGKNKRGEKVAPAVSFQKAMEFGLLNKLTPAERNEATACLASGL